MHLRSQSVRSRLIFSLLCSSLLLHTNGTVSAENVRRLPQSPPSPAGNIGDHGSPAAMTTRLPGADPLLPQESTVKTSTERIDFTVFQDADQLSQRFHFVFEPSKQFTDTLPVDNVVGGVPPTNYWPNDNHSSSVDEPLVVPQSRSVNDAGSQAGVPAVWNVYITNPVTPPQAPVTTIQPAPISIYNVPPSPEPVGDVVTQRRREIGAKVSDEILGKRKEPLLSLPNAPLSESVTAVQLLRECEEKALSADRLLKRGAAFAAREDAIEALRQFAAARDIQNGGRAATDAFDEAVAAMREAGDFLGRYGNVDRDGVSRMVASHETQVLKDTDLSQVTPHAAADVYLDYARHNLTFLVSGHAQGARLLLLLANTEKARRATDGNISDSIAITCLRAAVGASPQDPMLASELGFHALRAGHLGEASWALERSIAIQPSTPALQNLAETYRLAGDLDRARQTVARLSNSDTDAARSMLVTTVPSTTFAQISPPVQTQGSNSQVFAAHSQAIAGMQSVAHGQQPVNQQWNGQGNPAAAARSTAQGFSNGPQPAYSHPVPQNQGPSIMDRMANAVKNGLR